METQKAPVYAGFWIRFIAFIIDCIVVSIIVFPFALIIGLLSPNIIVVDVPFNLFTSSETMSESKSTEDNLDGSSSAVVTQINKENVLGQWEYYYKVTTRKNDGKKETNKVLINSVTKLPMDTTTSGDIEFFIIFIYWILMESSRYQGSVGKKIMSIKVVNMNGGRPTIFESSSRNLLKILSGMTLFIGFMMAGWTSQKQTLHDKISKTLIVESTQKIN